MAEGQELVTREGADGAFPEAGRLLSLLYRVAVGSLVRHTITSEEPAFRQGPQLEG